MYTKYPSPRITSQAIYCLILQKQASNGPELSKDLSFDAATMKIVSFFWNFSCSESFLLDDNNSGLNSNSKSALFYREFFSLTSRRLTLDLSKKNHNSERTTITKIIVYIYQLLTHFCFPTLGLQQLFLHLDVFNIEVIFINFWICFLWVLIFVYVYTLRLFLKWFFVWLSWIYLCMM
jgi:hypothetical protein